MAHGEAVVHGVPSESTFAQDLRMILQDTKQFVRDRRQVTVVLIAIGLSGAYTRWLLRQEIKNIHFSAEFFPGAEYEWQEDWN